MELFLWCLGPIGTGKTTIVNLLMKFYELHGGSIKIDGVGLTDMRKEQVRGLFVMGCRTPEKGGFLCGITSESFTETESAS